jgi:hypothetical protein
MRERPDTYCAERSTERSLVGLLSLKRSSLKNKDTRLYLHIIFRTMSTTIVCTITITVATAMLLSCFGACGTIITEIYVSVTPFPW